jgi:hypothetical protein
MSSFGDLGRFFETAKKKFVLDASPGSAGCFKKATETPNAGHPIYR